MLTRLRVHGFKNLLDVDVRFGPFTCIAGPNGIGKSNLFDAIHFLSLLADKNSLVEAASKVRGGGSGVRRLFFRDADRAFRQMSFEAEMLVPREATDDLGQPARASTTFLRYELILGLRQGEDVGPLGGLEVCKEQLTYVTQRDAPHHLLFDHTASTWRDSLLHNVRRTKHFLSTQENERGETFIQVHQDGGSRGQPTKALASTLPRTVLSESDAAASPTALVARREMQSWQRLQLEPSALRRPDAFVTPTHLEPDGAHLAATIHRLARQGVLGAPPPPDPEHAYAALANRLSDLYEDVKAIRIDRDERRELLTLLVETRDGIEHPASSLSDGSLRFLALAVLEMDPLFHGVLCMEEPENGIHPARLPEMLHLLQDIPVDPHEAVDEDNPLRQVIVNTHSPAVVSQVKESDLLIATTAEKIIGGARRSSLELACLPGTWRAGVAPTVPLGDYLRYVDPIEPEDVWKLRNPGRGKARRVIDRDEIQRQLGLFDHAVS